MITFILIVLLAAALRLVVLLIAETYRQQNPGSASRATSFSNESGSGFNDVSDSTQVQLFAMVGGNRRTATRLLAQVRQTNPGKTEQWIWEKAIYDLERDRR